LNYLEICQRVRLESGISGVGPTTVTGQLGQLGKITNWVKSSWLEIQTEREDWDWMWGQVEVDTDSDQDVYALETTDVKYLDWVGIYTKSLGVSDESEIEEVSYKDMRRNSKLGTPDSGRPCSYAIRPDKSLVLDPTPDDIYTLSIDYYKLPQVLTSNTDTPNLPIAYHDIIVWKACMMFAAHYEASMQYQHAAAEYARVMANLEMNQLPRMKLSGPLA